MVVVGLFNTGSSYAAKADPELGSSCLSFSIAGQVPPHLTFQLMFLNKLLICANSSQWCSCRFHCLHNQKYMSKSVGSPLAQSSRKHQGQTCNSNKDLLTLHSKRTIQQKNCEVTHHHIQVVGSGESKFKWNLNKTVQIGPQQNRMWRHRYEVWTGKWMVRVTFPQKLPS